MLKQRTTNTLAVFTLCFGLVVPAHATLIHFGIDPGAGPASARPNSDNARAAFTLAAGTVTTIDFESLPTDNANDITPPLVLDPNTTLNLSAGYSLRIGGIGDPFNGFATSGVNSLWSTALGPNNRTLTFNFGDGITSFGSYITGLGTAGGSTVTIGYNDGSSQNFNLTGSGSGGVLFWGVTHTSMAINAVTYTQNNGGDGWTIDDFAYSDVPENGTLALLGIGLTGLVWMRRRRRLPA